MEDKLITVKESDLNALYEICEKLADERDEAIAKLEPREVEVGKYKDLLKQEESLENESQENSDTEPETGGADYFASN